MTIIRSKKRMTTNLTEVMMSKMRKIISIAKRNKVEAKITIITHRKGNLKMITTLDIWLRIFKLNFLHKASKHYKKKFKTIQKDYCRTRNGLSIWRDLEIIPKRNISRICRNKLIKNSKNKLIHKMINKSIGWWRN